MSTSGPSSGDQPPAATAVQIFPDDVRCPMLGRGHKFKVNFPDCRCGEDVVKITANEATDAKSVDPNLQVRSGPGGACCCFSMSAQRTLITIGNKEQTQFVEQLSFDYPQPRFCKDKKKKRIEFTSPGSAGPVAWISTNSDDVANGAKVGLCSDPGQSHKFTTQGITSQDKSLTIRNLAGEGVAKGRITDYTMHRSSMGFPIIHCAMGLGIEDYNEIEITLPRWGDPSVSEVEREIIFAVLILWAISAKDSLRRKKCVRAVIVLCVGCLLVAALVLLFIFIAW